MPTIKTTSRKFGDQATNTPRNIPTELISKRELAMRLKLSERTIENHTKKGLLPSIRIGASVRYIWDEVIAALHSQQPAQ